MNSAVHIKSDRKICVRNERKIARERNSIRDSFLTSVQLAIMLGSGCECQIDVFRKLQSKCQSIMLSAALNLACWLLMASAQTTFPTISMNNVPTRTCMCEKAIQQISESMFLALCVFLELDFH